MDATWADRTRIEMQASPDGSAYVQVTLHACAYMFLNHSVLNVFKPQILLRLI